MPPWLWQGLAINGVSIVIGIVMTVLKKYKNEWATPILYGLSTIALLTVIFVGFRGIQALAAIPKRSSIVTPDNIESYIKTWADDFNASVQNVPDTSTRFSLILIVARRLQVSVTQLKAHDNILVFQATSNVPTDLRATMVKMNKDQGDEVLQQLSLQLAKLSVTNHIAIVSHPALHADEIAAIELIKSLPITDSITEDSFGGALNEI